MKKEDFDKNIKIYFFESNRSQALELQSILYTPIPYRIPVSFADTINSANDTEKYIKENYSKEEQEALKHNEKINNQFLKELLKFKKPSDDDAFTLAKKYHGKLKKIKYKAPDTLRNITTNDDLDKMAGYFVIDANALINTNEELLTEFLNLNFNNFNDFLVFFTKYFGMFIDLFDDSDLKDIKIDELTDLNIIISLARKAYSLKKTEIINTQKLFSDFVNLLYGYKNNKEIDSLTLKQKFYVFYEEHRKELDKISSNYQHYGSFNFEYSEKYNEKLKHKSTTELIAKIKKIDKNGDLITNLNGISTQNIYTVFYISIYYSVLNNSVFIRQCKNCHRYFITSKSNTFFCDNVYYAGKTCKEVGNQLQQKRKEDQNPVYSKYRKKFANKATLLKRNPDVYSKEDYDNWKKEAQQYIQDIKNGLKTEDEFDKWLDKHK